MNLYRNLGPAHLEDIPCIILTHPQNKSFSNMILFVWSIKCLPLASWAQIFPGQDLQFLRSRDVINHVTIWFIICPFLLAVHWIPASTSNGFQNICILIYLDHNLDLLGSKLSVLSAVRTCSGRLYHALGVLRWTRGAVYRHTTALISHTTAQSPRGTRRVSYCHTRSQTNGTMLFWPQRTAGEQLALWGC